MWQTWETGWILTNKNVKETCTETEMHEVEMEISKTNISWSGRILSIYYTVSKYIPVGRQQLDRYTDRLQLLERRLDTLQADPFHYTTYILRMCSLKYKQPDALNVSNSQGKWAKQHLHAGWLGETDKSGCYWAAVAPQTPVCREHPSPSETVNKNKLKGKQRGKQQRWKGTGQQE